VPAQARMSKPPSGSYSRTRGNPATAPRVGRVVPPNSRGRHFSSGGGTPDNLGPSGGSGSRGSGGSGGGSLTGRDLQTTSAAPKLAAEFLLCAVLIVAVAMSKSGSYLDRMSEILWRLTATVALFFVLSLISMNKNTTKITVAFGGLVVGAILLKDVNSMTRLFNILAGQGTGDTEDVLTSDVKTPEVKPNILT
jgi:hypothetical protein